MKMQNDSFAERDLLLRLRESSEEAERAMEVILDLYYRQVYRFALTWLRGSSHEDVEDVVAVVFWQFWRRATKIAVDESFDLGTYLKHLTRNACLEHLRRTHRQQLRQGRFTSVGLEAASEIAASTAASPEQLQEVEHVVSKLIDFGHGSFTLTSESAACREIGEILGTSPEAVHRAVTQLRRTVEGATQESAE